LRAAALERLPSLAHFYGLMPWDLDRLSPVELEQFLDFMDR
jgi:hypothetical protein